MYICGTQIHAISVKIYQWLRQQSIPGILPFPFSFLFSHLFKTVVCDLEVLIY